MYLTDFEFNGKRLSDFGSIPCVINSSTDAQRYLISASRRLDDAWNTTTLSKPLSLKFKIC